MRSLEKDRYSKSLLGHTSSTYILLPSLRVSNGSLETEESSGARELSIGYSLVSLSLFNDEPIEADFELLDVEPRISSEPEQPLPPGVSYNPTLFSRSNSTIQFGG
ncbi:hypothetical protein A2U01_0041998 [Trifolium medium]|uniref:Uncharacterized protein n=1 Tax=Trifolium medium TaxID=97028 RepID=A0A392QC36_9FABA|nr:hypothetical protein [Trifolium medium]